MMKFNRIPLLLAALAVAVPAMSMADPQDRNDSRDHRAAASRHDRADWNHPGYRHDNSRGAGPRHDWQRGGRLPNEYRGNQYVVDDWRGHHLSAPPRGYHWVQAGSDYVLAAVATGIILDTLLSQ
jgi:Ni/Co efflux regulator RcnB